MCAIAGIWQPFNANNNGQALVEAMLGTMYHRGPDDSGYVCMEAQNLGFGHRRLSIVDVSNAGHQPMVSKSGRFTLVFNGEIYNHIRLRKNLETRANIQWHGHSDTETMLACFECWGVEHSLTLFEGMFAFAVWDEKKQSLALARDRLGEKPLYYGWHNGQFLFASELCAIKANAAFNGHVSREALAALLQFNYIPAPLSIYEGIYKLEAGQFLTLPAENWQNDNVKPKAYWSLPKDAIANGRQQPFSGSFSEAASQLDRLASAAVAEQMLADVPLGAFLSGGIDSSTIVALMQSQSLMPINTFTLGFDVPGFNEAQHAKAVAKHLATNHHEMIANANDCLNVVERLPEVYSEPFADSSQLPTFLVTQLAKQHVTVALSGDGGDELFAGYNRYQAVGRYWHVLKPMPLIFRKLLGQFLQALPKVLLQHFLAAIGKAQRWQNLPLTLQKVALAVAQPDILALYQSLVSQWRNAGEVVQSVRPSLNVAEHAFLKNLTDIEKMMALDAMQYLSDDILVKVDRAAMANSLEVRVPLLNHKIVEFAWSLPESYKTQQSVGKRVLREVLYKHVPKALIERPKVGFAVPIDAWLRCPLKDWAENLLDERKLKQQGFFHASVVRKCWLQHLAQKGNYGERLWSILMFQQWLAAQ